MAASDWTTLTGSADASLILRGVTAGITAPNGGGEFVYGFNSLSVGAGTVALSATQNNFAPMAKGGSVRATLQRGKGGGSTGFSPFLFICCQGTAITDQAYLLGLQDDDPSRIALVKGPLSGGIPSGLPGTNGILAKANVPTVISEWVHLRLDAVANENGDVVLKVWQNDLSVHSVTSPLWAAVPGIADYIDDCLRVNTGSAPLTSGRAGFGFQSADVSRRAYVDHIEIARQL